MSKNFQEFLDDYAGYPERKVVTIDLADHRDSPFIVVKHGSHAAIINPSGQTDHLSIDVHPFVDGQDAMAGVFGIVDGRRLAFRDEETPHRSHGWPATRLVVVLIGEQA